MRRYDDNNTKILLFDLYTTNVMGEKPDYAVSKQEFTAFLENEAKLRVDDFIIGAIEIAEEVHSGVKREDRLSPFLETHTLKWPSRKIGWVGQTQSVLEQIRDSL